MKTLLLALFVTLSLGAQELRRTNDLYVTWDQYPNPTGNTGLSFNIYRSPVLPATTWVFYTNLTWVSLSNQPPRIRIPNQAATEFFVLTATNQIGESGFSAPVAKEALLPGQGFRLSF